MHDCGIVSQNIALAAHSMGLASCICAMARIPLDGARGAEFLDKLGFPAGFTFGMSVRVGAPAADGVKAPHALDPEKILYFKG
jgi:nitroreductase